MFRKKEPVPNAGAPQWITAYSGMLTLLLVFFVLLLSFSTIDADKWKTLVSSVAGGPGVLPGDYIRSPAGMGDHWEASGGFDEDAEYIRGLDEWQTEYYRLVDYVASRGLDADVLVEYSDAEMILRFRSDILFDSAKAILKDPAKAILVDLFKSEIIPRLSQLSSIRIDGHTDNLPINTAQFADNLQLSQARSWSVYKYIVEIYPSLDPDFPPIPPELVEASGRGEWHPVDTNDTEAGRAKNRRVDLVLVRRAVSRNVSDTIE